MRILFFQILFIIIIAHPLFSQKTNPRFVRINDEQGLSQNTVNCIVQDRKGFLWIATEDGLNRYDGYSFRVYKHHNDIPSSISYNYIQCLLESRSGNIWIGTDGGGLNKLDESGNGFIFYLHDSANIKSISSNFILALHEDHSGNLWIGTKGGGLNHFDISTKEFIHYLHTDADSSTIPSKYITSLLQDSSGNLWVGTYGEGLNRLETKSKKIVRYLHDPSDPATISDNYIRSIFNDHSGNLWIGTENGLNRLDNSGRRFIHYLHDDADATTISSNLIMPVLQDYSSNLWVGTWGRGLNRLDASGKNFIHYIHDPADISTIASNDIMYLFEDSYRNLWVGTLAGGLNRLDESNKNFNHYFHDPANKASISGNRIFSFLEDRSGNLWVGSEKGLDRSENSGKEFIHYFHDAADRGSVSKNEIQALLEGRAGDLWIGTWGGGLNRFDKSTNSFIRYSHDNANAASISSNYILCLLQASSGAIWVGTWTGGLNRFDVSTKIFTHYRHDDVNPASISSDGIKYLMEDHSGKLWVATKNGLNVLDGSGNGFIYYFHDAANAGSISSNDIYSILEDRKGNLWVGTHEGLNLLVHEKGVVFLKWTESNSAIPNNLIYGILEDDHGNLWMSTNKGLSRFTPPSQDFILNEAKNLITKNLSQSVHRFDRNERGIFRNYDVSDGIQGNEFNECAFYKSKEGWMHFGGINGFNRFHPDSIRDNLILPKVVITRFEIFNQNVGVFPDPAKTEKDDETENIISIDRQYYLPRLITYIDKVRLSYSENFFTFEYAALHYTKPWKNQYAYKMEGFDKEWNYVGTKRYATFTNLSPGEYIFRVKASNCDGVWNEEGARLKIIITPPFWNTNWFYGLCIISLVSGLALFIKMRERNLQQAKRVLEQTVKDRTAVIEKTNQTLNEANIKLKELESFKETMMGMIVHDLKNPLNVVIGYANEEPSEKSHNVIARASKQMLNLVMNILDVQKFEETKVNLNLENNNLSSMVENAIQEVETLANQKNIRIDNLINEKYIITLDLALMSRAFVNLLNNAIKFTPDGGSIAMNANMENSDLIITVSDTGIGIPTDQIKTIFKKYSQIAGKKSIVAGSTGLGLTFCKMAVEAHGGKIEVESEVGAGSTFYIILPLVLTQAISNDHSDSAIVFMETEKAIIQPIVEKLKKLTVCDTVVILDILNNLNENTSEDIAKWKLEMTTAVFHCDEKRYEKLITSATSHTPRNHAGS